VWVHRPKGALRSKYKGLFLRAAAPSSLHRRTYDPSIQGAWRPIGMGISFLSSTCIHVSFQFFTVAGVGDTSVAYSKLLFSPKLRPWHCCIILLLRGLLELCVPLPHFLQHWLERRLAPQVLAFQWIGCQVIQRFIVVFGPVHVLRVLAYQC